MPYNKKPDIGGELDRIVNMVQGQMLIWNGTQWIPGPAALASGNPSDYDLFRAAANALNRSGLLPSQLVAAHRKARLRYEAGAGREKVGEAEPQREAAHRERIAETGDIVELAEQPVNEHLTETGGEIVALMPDKR